MIPKASLKLFAVLVFCFYSTCIYCKPDDQVKQIRFGINVLPEVSLNDDLHSNAGDVFKMSYSGGLNISIQNVKSFGVSVGVHYSIVRMQEAMHEYGDISTTYNFPYDSTLSMLSEGSNSHFIDIPVMANFIFGSGKTKFAINGGFKIGYLFNINETKAFQYKNGRIDQRTSSSTAYNGISFGPMFSVGIDKTMNDWFSFKIEPTLSLQIPKNNLESYWLAGINFILLEHLRN